MTMAFRTSNFILKGICSSLPNNTEGIFCLRRFSSRPAWNFLERRKCDLNCSSTESIKHVTSRHAKWKISGYRSLSASSSPTVRIGCASGFWGDTALAAPQLIHQGKIDFLVMDYLSEITMSLLTAAKQKSGGRLGFAPDFILAVMKPNLKAISSKGIKVVANCGGVNPHACAKELADVAAAAGVALKVAVVAGDDLLTLTKPENAEILSRVMDMSSMAPFPDPSSVTSMNAYLGAFPIATALNHGADVVITGRCVDSALVLGPLISRFGWRENDLDLLAAGSLAGHLVECGAQATGGVLTDWETTAATWDSIGFPIVEVSPTGGITLTKPEGTGGAVTVMSATEQLLYEIGDPRCYILPDVVCDFSNVQIEQVEKEAVSIRGAKGLPAPDDFKVCATYLDGYKLTAVCPIAGRLARDKGRAVADAILKRSRTIFKKLGFEDYSHTEVQIHGAGEMFGDQARPSESSSREVVLWLAVRHSQKQALEFLAREIAPAGTGMAPGLCGMVGGRPKVSPVLRLYSFLWSKKDVNVDVFIDGELIDSVDYFVSPSHHGERPTVLVDLPQEDPTNSDTPQLSEQPTKPVPLSDIACARSGDKGNSVNIGVIARTPSMYPEIQRNLSTEKVFDYFAHLFPEGATAVSHVERFEVPGVKGLNFVLKDVLGGGGIASCRIDPQGKAMAQMLLDIEVQVS